MVSAARGLHRLPYSRLGGTGLAAGSGLRYHAVGLHPPKEPDLPRDSWEPIEGANVARFVSTHRDVCRALPQVSGSHFDSLRPRQTPVSCLGVRGSPVQIQPSRRFFEHFGDQVGTKREPSGNDHGRASGREAM